MLRLLEPELKVEKKGDESVGPRKHVTIMHGNLRSSCLIKNTTTPLDSAKMPPPPNDIQSVQQEGRMALALYRSIY
jgi:hypothetical protein